MQDTEVTQLATAIAQANGHPEPEGYAARVLAHFKGEVAHVIEVVKQEAESVAQHVEAVLEPHVAADQEVPNGQQ